MIRRVTLRQVIKIAGKVGTSNIIRSEMALWRNSARMLGIIAFAVFTIFITWRAKALEKEFLLRSETSELVDEAAPEFKLASLDGQTVSLTDFRGKKKVVLSFWASWCGPCRLEMPELQSFYVNHHKNADTFELLAISIDDERGAAEAFAKEANLPFPVLLDPASKAARAFGVSGIPMMFVIDESGKVIYGHVGYEGGLEYILKHELGLDKTEAKGETANGQSSR